MAGAAGPVTVDGVTERPEVNGVYSFDVAHNGRPSWRCIPTGFSLWFDNKRSSWFIAPSIASTPVACILEAGTADESQSQFRTQSLGNETGTEWSLHVDHPSRGWMHSETATIT